MRAVTAAGAQSTAVRSSRAMGAGTRTAREDTAVAASRRARATVAIRTAPAGATGVRSSLVTVARSHLGTASLSTDVRNSPAMGVKSSPVTASLSTGVRNSPDTDARSSLATATSRMVVGRRTTSMESGGSSMVGVLDMVTRGMDGGIS